MKLISGAPYCRVLALNFPATPQLHFNHNKVGTDTLSVANATVACCMHKSTLQHALGDLATWHDGSPCQFEGPLINVIIISIITEISGL